ncbi:hypothetical protein GDO81_014204 [Engystomops pustulosus]|uniref:Uncharacterized protein n=1 Tax=Engystomops pustulosus TaxID=76066 RepID=A0AAV7B8K3_ENGPU|nr:hypothetical protein GDO81_014204 [Engystomops pustulosus]
MMLNACTCVDERGWCLRLHSFNPFPSQLSPGIASLLMTMANMYPSVLLSDAVLTPSVQQAGFHSVSRWWCWGCSGCYLPSLT